MLPGQINSFNQFRNQIEQAEASLASLRGELRRLGTMEAAIDIPSRPVGQAELLTPMSPSELGGVQAAQQENNLREQRNARRTQLASDIAAQEAGLAILEKKTETVGRNIARNQETAARLIKNRDPANTTGLQISLNQIQAQAESLALVANNSEIASTSFNRFTVAAEMASIKLARAQQSTFTALAAGFSGGGGVNIPGGLRQEADIAGARNMVGQLISDIPNLTRSEGALNAHIQLLSQIRTILPFLSLEYRAVEEAIAGLGQELEGVGLRGQTSKIDPGAGQRFLKQREREDKIAQSRATAIDKVYQEQLGLTDKIASSKLSVTDKEDLSLRLNQALDALGESQLENAAAMTRQIADQLKLKERLAKLNPQGRGEQKVFGTLGASFLPVTGELPSTVSATGQKIRNLVPGSPAARLEEASANEKSTKAAIALAKQKLQAVEDEAEELRKGTTAATALGKQKLKALEDQAKALRDETSAAVELAQQRSKEQERMIADAWKLSGGPALPPWMQSKQKVFGTLGTSFMPISGEMPKGRSQLQAAEAQKAAREIAAQQIVVNKLQRQYTLEEGKGAQLLQEKVQLNGMLDMLAKGQVTSTKANSAAIGKNIKYFKDMLALRVLEAKVAGTYQGGGGKKVATAEQIEGRRSKLLERALGVQGTTISLEAKGAQVAQERQEIEATILRLKQLQGQASEDDLKILLKQIQNLKIANKEISNALPRTQKGGGGAADNTPFLEQRFGKRGSAAISEGLIGGAFPLLFGQGLGASVLGAAGGAVGGFAGGGLGFGLSLIGTALGTAFDTLAQAAQDTGKSLNYPIEGFEKLKAAGLFASRDQEYYISKLIETGQTSKATAEIQAEMIKKIGVSGVNDLMKLGDASTELGKAWAEFTLQLQAALAGPMAGLLEWVTSVVELSTGGVQKEAQNLDPEAFRKAQEQANRTAQQGKPFFSDQDKVAYEKELNRLSREIIAKTGVSLIKETKQDPAQQEAALQAQRQVADQIKSAYREGFQLQQRAIDLETKTADIRRRIENEIFSKQQDLLQQQVDGDRKRAQIAIEAVDLEYQKRIANEEGRAAEVLAAEAEFFKTRAQGEAEIATAKKLLELDIAKRQRETQDYVYSLGREADSIRRETLSFEMEVADYRLKIEREIENERLVAAAAERAGATTATAVQTKGGAAAFMTGGAFDTGLRTGPSSVIGGSAPYHQDISFGPSVGLEQQRQLVVALAKAYDDMGRKIELSNEAVQGRVFPLRGTIAEQNKFITDALAAHRGRNGGTGRSAIDFYTPAKGGNRFGESVVNTAMYAPVVPGASLAYGRGGGAGSSITATKGGQKIFQLMHGRTDIPLPGASAIARRVAEARPSTAMQLEQARSQVRRPAIMPVPVEAAVGARTALNAEDTRIKEEAIGLDQKLAQLQEERARQRLYEVARGPIEIKQRQEVVDLAKAELAVIRPMSQDKQEAVLFEAQASEILRNREATDKEILKITKLQGEEKKKLEQALADGLANTQKQIELDREALRLAQERRFIEEQAGLTQQLAVTGMAEQAGFFGAGASAYTNELLRSGDAGRATELAQQSRAIEAKQAVAGIQGELNGLIDSTNVAIKAAEGVGDAFGNAFLGLINKSMSAREALASFFSSVSEAFLGMAAEIIAKQTTMIVLQTILKALGAVSGGVSPSAPGGDWMAAVGRMNPTSSYATGGAFANGIQPFAKGGTFSNSIVSSPTLFKFADGGTTQMGEMGEAGPEAIMPLSRGRGGRLGVDASGLREAMGRPPGGATGSPVLNMSFQSTTFNGVEYVSRDQLEAAMAQTRRQAAKDGANRGMTMTLDKIQNSPSTRSRVGIR